MRCFNLEEFTSEIPVVSRGTVPCILTFWMLVHEAQKFQKAIVGMSLDDIKKKLPVSKTPKLAHPCPLSVGHDRNLSIKKRSRVAKKNRQSLGCSFWPEESTEA